MSSQQHIFGVYCTSGCGSAAPGSGVHPCTVSICVIILVLFVSSRQPGLTGPGRLGRLGLGPRNLGVCLGDLLVLEMKLENLLKPALGAITASCVSQGAGAAASGSL